jgi:hypothetical protein
MERSPVLVLSSGTMSAQSLQAASLWVQVNSEMSPPSQGMAFLIRSPV